MVDAPPPPRDAATLVLLRDSPAGPQVLMLRRHVAIEFAGDAWVFPGGAVDAADRTLDPQRWAGIDPDALAVRFAEPADLVLGYHVACVRETFEEAGVLFARRADGQAAELSPEQLAAGRALLADRGQRGRWVHWLAQEDLVLDLSALAYLARWITPAQAPKRFDACFFVARAPAAQQVEHDQVETTAQAWLSPAEALAGMERGELEIWHPTEQTLRTLATFASVDAVLAHARTQREIRGVQPHIDVHPGGWRVLHPDDPDYPHERYGPGGDLTEAR